VQKSAGKFLASILALRRRLAHYLPNGQTIKAVLLVQLKGILKENRCGKVTKGVLFLHDNAPAHRTLATQKAQWSLYVPPV
jgi:hypothetical protein